MTIQATPLKVLGYVASKLNEVSDDNDSSDSSILSVKELTASNTQHLAFSWEDTDKNLYVAKGGICGRLPYEVVFEFDASVDTDKLAVGTHVLRSTGVPKNFVATNLKFWVDTVFASGGSATVAFGLETTDDNILLVATAIGTMGTAGGHLGTCVQTDPTKWSAKTAAADEIDMIVATAALTGGKCIGFVQGFIRA